MTGDKVTEQLRHVAAAYKQGFADGYRVAKKELITCKECRHRPTEIEEEDETYIEFPENSRCPCHCEDQYYNWMPADDWFCGNGERKE